MPLSKKRDKERKRLERSKTMVGNGGDGTCANCGEARVIDIHHIDSDHSNNESTNLMSLCPTCHALVTRKVVTLSNLIQPKHPVQPAGSIDGLIMDGNRIVGVKPAKQASTPSEVPIYSPYEHYEPGDKVLILRGKRMIETVIPKVDADGNVIYEE